MRLVFMGTPDFAVPSLEAIRAAGHHILAVYTQPPRPAGRGKTLRPSPVAQAAAAFDIPVRTPKSLKGPAEIAAFEALGAELGVVVAYGLILPAPILAVPRLGCINLHASLLPRWRGAAPIQRAIMAGDAETGIDVMQMEAGLDTGPILARARVPIGPCETAGELHDRLAPLGASLLVRTIDALARGAVHPVPQSESGVVYAKKIEKSEGRIDWRKSAGAIDRLIRGLTPSPGAYFSVPGADGASLMLRVLRARPVEGRGEPGLVLAGPDLVIACGEDALSIERIQRPGKSPQDAQAFLRGFALGAGTRLPQTDDP